ncbi:MAG TPA: PQQ-binding-like beta-propeller repeat protein [Nitriliruptorales bacterium]
MQREGHGVNGGVRGRVTDGARGAAGVLVSDGVTVTRTDAHGAFELPGGGPFVTVTRPTGWATATWYLPADAPTLEFVLHPVEQPLPLTFVHVTDLHVSLGDTASAPDGSDATIYPGSDGALHERVVTSPEVLGALWRDIADHVPDAAFVAATGDLTNTGADAEYRAWVASVAQCPVPIVSIPGNHDHHAQDGELPDGATSVDVHAVPDRYEAHLGPRWFSFDHAGLHVVAIDWFTHLLDLDRQVQERWLHADLAAIPADQPVVLLSHDQMGSDFFQRLPRQPIATFSGHWHTSRIARVGATLHVNTPTATFGGLDYSPAAYRIVRWDGCELDVRTVARATRASPGDPSPPDPARATGASPGDPSPPDPARVTGAAPGDPSPPDLARATYRSGGGTNAFARLPGAAHRAGPVIAGDLVIATSRDEDRPAGWVTALDRHTGTVAWQVELGSAVKASPTLAADAVVATAVTGETVCVGLDGTERWRRHLADPLHLWTYLRPACDGARVYVGDVGRFCALDLRTGEVVWERDDLGRRENLTSWADPVIVEATLLVGFAGQTPALWGLDPATGASRWPDVDRGRSVYRLPPAEVAVELARTVTAPPLPDGAHVYLTRLGATIERLRAADGTTLWTAAHHGWFNPGTPAIVGDLLVAATGTGRVRAYARDTGELRWDTAVAGPAPLAAGPYRADGPLVLGGVTAAGDGVVVATGDGCLVSLSRDGQVTRRTRLPAPALGGVTVESEHAWTVTTDGGLHRIPLA